MIHIVIKKRVTISFEKVDIQTLRTANRHRSNMFTQSGVLEGSKTIYMMIVQSVERRKGEYLKK